MLVDFGRWADEEYRVPGRQINPSEAGEQPPHGEANDNERSH